MLWAEKAFRIARVRLLPSHLSLETRKAIPLRRLFADFQRSQDTMIKRMHCGYLDDAIKGECQTNREEAREER